MALADEGDATKDQKTDTNAVEKAVDSVSASDVDAAKAVADFAKADMDSAKADMESAQNKVDQTSASKNDAEAKADAADKDARDEFDREIDNAQGEIEKATGDIESAKNDQASAEKNLDDAKAEAEEAKKEQSAAADAVKKAQDNLDAVDTSKYDAAKDAQDKAQSSYDSAKNNQASAETAKAEADKKLEQAAQAKTDAASKLETAKSDLAAAETAKAKADKAYADAKSAFEATVGCNTSEYDARVSEATAALDAAKKVKAYADAKVDSAKSAYDKTVAASKQAETDREAASKTASDAKDDYDAAVKANENRDALQTKVDEAKAKLDAAKAKVDAAKANEDLLNKQGMLGLFEIMSKDSSLTETQRNNAAEALRMLRGTSTIGDKPEWFDELVSGPENEMSPLSRTSLERILDYLDPTNTLRQDNKVPDLKVGLMLMAKAAINTCYSYYTFDHAGSNYGIVASENIASINWSADYEGGMHEDDVWWPYSGWYTEEKAIYDAGGDYTYADVGHYLNLISDQSASFGMAMGQGAKLGPNAFGSSVITWDASWREGDFTVADFKKIVRSYLYGYSDAVDALEAAQKAYDAAIAELNALPDSEAAKATYESAKKALAAAEANVATKAAAVESAKSAYDDAVSGQSTKAAELTSAESVLNGLTGTAAASAKSAMDNAKATLDAAATTAAAKKLAVAAAEEKFSDAEALLVSAQATADVKAGDLAKAQAATKTAEADLEAAKQAAADAYAFLADVFSAYNEAAAKKEAADARVANAQKAVADAESALAQAKDDLSDAESAKEYWTDILAALNAVDIDQVIANGTTGNDRLADLNAKLASAKDAREAATAYEWALAVAKNELAGKVQAYETARVAYAKANEAYETVCDAYAEQQQYIKNTTLPDVSNSDALVVAAVKAGTPTAKPATARHFAKTASLVPTTGDSVQRGETFVIGGLTLVAAGVFLSRRRENGESRA